MFKEVEQVLTLHRLFRCDVSKTEVYEIYSMNNLAHAVQSHLVLDIRECKSATSYVKLSGNPNLTTLL